MGAGGEGSAAVSEDSLLERVTALYYRLIPYVW